MDSARVPLPLPPGVYRNGTMYQAKGRWFDAHLVRFSANTIKPIGGWRRMEDDSGDVFDLLVGKARAVTSWRGDDSDRFVALATTSKLHIIAGGQIHDITPVGFVAGQADTGTAGSGNYSAGAYGTGAFGVGASTAAIIAADTWQLDTFGDFLVGVCTSDNKLYVWQGNVGTPAAKPSAAGVGTVAAAAGAATFSTSQLGVIQNGSRIIVGGNSYTVSAFNGTTSCTLSGSPTFGASAFSVESCPVSVNGVVVTPERFLVVLGVDGNARKLAWPSQETTTDWIPTATNTAGDFELTTPGALRCARRTRHGTLIFTDADVHLMQYIGGTLVYRFDSAGEQCGTVSPGSPVAIDTRVLWMGKNNFFVYDGFTRPLPCDVWDHVFGDFNEMQSVKVWGMSVAQFGEVWWFYPSAASAECDRYVVYNYIEQHWTTGHMSRSAGTDAGALANPVLVAPSGEIFEHELLQIQSRPAVAGEIGGVLLLAEDGDPLVTEGSEGEILTEDLVPYLESGPFELGNGDRVVSVKELIPDEKSLGGVNVTIYSSFDPLMTEDVDGPFTLETPTDLRIEARQLRLRLEETEAGDWRVGTLRLGVAPSSAR